MILAGLETFSQNLRIKYEVTANYREQQIFLITILKSTFVTSEVRCLSPREGLIEKRRVYFNYTMTYTPGGNAVEKGVTMSIYPFWTITYMLRPKKGFLVSFMFCTSFTRLCLCLFLEISGLKFITASEGLMAI